MNSSIDKSMNEAVRNGFFPSAELLVAKGGEVLHHKHYGDARQGTAFDVASLTKPLVTSTSIMLLAGQGALKPDQKLTDWFKHAQHETQSITVEMLLNHTSGLPSWKPYYRELPSTLVGTEEGKNFIIDSCIAEPLQHSPGSSTLYSDIGYIILGEIVARSSGKAIDEFFRERIAEPLTMRNSFFVHNRGELRTTSRRTDTTADQHVPTRERKSSPAGDSSRRRFAATEDCPWRGRVIHGEVHDQNAYAMGGIAGHSGLFSTAEDIHRFLLHFMASFDSEGGLLSPQMVKMFFPLEGNLIRPPSPGLYVGGWDTPVARGSAAGHHASPHSIGHLAYTGCSIWVDQGQDFWIIMLTNRIHPSTTNERIKAFRPQIHDLIYTTLINP